ncbi:hypothetical protein KUTeg_022097 [Tegillarca granosa]|uniref:N-acetylneuraminate lyase n=1 Tax=Tegillarca granosa TaxID=220873 RepID=A0ABQ9E592_TEGGR|nr:hypothetical protein KUTeg_022097 [Tegillarca granosa]
MEAKKFINAYLKGKIPNIKYRTALSDNSWLNIIRINRKFVCKSINVFTLSRYGISLRNGIHHIYVNGTTGEGASLTVDERKQIVEKWLSAAKGKLSVTARHAQEVGADAIGALPSLFFKPQSLVNMEDFLTQAKDKIPTLNGIKFSSKDLVDMIGCVHVDGGKFNILYGCDEQLMAGFVMGAQGAVGSLHNFIPHVYQRMIKNLDDGDIIKARGEQIKGQRTCRILYKYVGFDVGPPRQPMRKIKEHELENLRAELEAIGFFNWH